MSHSNCRMRFPYLQTNNMKKTDMRHIVCTSSKFLPVLLKENLKVVLKKKYFPALVAKDSFAKS